MMITLKYFLEKYFPPKERLQIIIENTASTHADYAICAYKYSVTVQHCTHEGDIAMRQ